jgi:hypothetical protein
MIGVVALAIFSAPSLAPPIPWASGFAPEGSLAFVADMNGDGFADLIRVYPKGDAFIDVSLNVEGFKAGRPDRALSNWGTDCQAAAVGNLDDAKQATVVGLFAGNSLRLATCDASGHFTDAPDWFKLPAKLGLPHLGFNGANLLAWDEKSGRGFSVDAKKAAVPLKFPAGVASVQTRVNPSGTPSSLVFQMVDGSVKEADLNGMSLRPIGKVAKGHNPLVADSFVYVDTVQAGESVNIRKFPTSYLPESQCIWASGDVDHDGDSDLFQFRFGKESHTGNDVLMYRTITPGEVDSDHDGLSNDEEVRLGTDPYKPDTSGDGILDGWKINGFRGLDLKGIGCKPGQIDIICLISRFSDVDEKFVQDTFTKVKAYYKSLPTKNPDGSTGWNLHPIFLPAVSGDDMKKPWWENRDHFLPAKWKGVVHWMQLTRGGGGQADELGDGGGCAGGGMALYATFIHEFGHQLGLPHNGFYEADGCPVYPSLMNYPYSYRLNGSIDNVSYSDGRLAKMVLNEADLDEVLPLPYDKVKFLANAPYNFHLKANGATTLIDWNWNGVFGEHHVKADINYAYSTTAGRRDVVDKTECAPWLFTHKDKAYVLYSRNNQPVDPKTDPSISAEHPGTLYLKRLKKPYEWQPIQTINYSVVTGDPTAVSFGGHIVAAYPSTGGILVQDIDDLGTALDVHSPEVIDSNGDLVPALCAFNGKLWLFLWDPKTQQVTYQVIRGGKTEPQVLSEKSTSPVGPAVDTIKHQLILGLTQDEDATHLSRWQIRRFVLKDGSFVANSMEWIEGPKGGAHSHSRSVVLFDADKSNGKRGRTYYFVLGDHSKENPWACCYVSMSIEDKTVRGGWLTKRYYDEWSQSRSAPAAAFFAGDIIYSYRWIDGGQGPTDNQLQVAYRGSGIEPTPMGDFDDISFIRNFGMEHCLMYLNR